jgi:RNA polymerase sigma-70 factor (ECF subfamily)
MEWDESTLSTAIQAGSAQAEEALVRRFQPRVRCLVETALRHGPDCEDLTCIILEEVIAGLRRGAFRGECRLGTYIYAVSRNRIAGHFRRRRPETAPLLRDLPDRGAPPDEQAVQAELDRALRQALSSLAPKYRTVLYLYFYRGMSIAEIAQALQVPSRRVSDWKDYGLGVLRSRHGRALDRFR